MFSCAFAQTAEPQGVLAVIDRLARMPLSKVVLFIAACTLVRLALHSYLTELSREDRGGSIFVRIAAELVDAAIYAGAIVFLIIRPFVMQTFWIPSESMLQTLKVNDYIIANKLIYRFQDPKPGDIVVFRPPDRAILPGHKKSDFIKRCIGGPGDLIEIKNSILYKNNKIVPEPYLRDEHIEEDFKLVLHKGKYVPVRISGEFVNSMGQTPPEFFPLDGDDSHALRESPAVRIPPGYFLMMGDNRNESHDGRTWGLVPRESIIGRSELIWLPIRRWQWTR